MVEKLFLLKIICVLNFRTFHCPWKIFNHDLFPDYGISFHIYNRRVLCHISLKQLLLWNEWLIQHHLCLLWQVFTMDVVTKVTQIHNTNGNCHMKWLESYRTCLIVPLMFLQWWYTEVVSVIYICNALLHNKVN